MEPLRITDFKKIVQNVILSNQDKLNPNHNAYIEKDEIAGLLSHFAAKDVSELMHDSSSTEDKEVGDTFEATKSVTPVVEKGNTEAELKTQEEEEVATPDKDEAVTLAEDEVATPGEADEQKEQSYFDDTAIRDEAKYGLETRIQNDIASYNLDDPCALAYQAIENKKGIVEDTGEDPESLDRMQRNLEKMSENYARNFATQLDDESSDFNKSSEITLKNGKKIKIEQTIGLGADTAIAQKETEETEEGGLTEEGETPVETPDDNDPNKNIFGGAISYGLNITGENFNTKFKLDASNENIDLNLGASYAKTFVDKSYLTATAVLRETIVLDKNSGSGGASLDYRKGDLYVGANGIYEHKRIGEMVSWEGETMAYARYKDNVTASIVGQYNQFFNNFEADVKLNGMKTINNDSLRLAGSVNVSAGILDFKEEKFNNNLVNDRIYTANVDAIGGLQFEAGDISANLSALATYNCSVGSLLSKEKEVTHGLGGAVFGNFTKDKFSVSAMVNFTKDDLSNKAVPPSIATNVVVQLKDLFKGISPFVSYTLDNSTAAVHTPYQHSVSGGLMFDLGKLSRK